MIDLKAVSVEFDDAGETVRALCGVTLSLSEGSFVWINGRSGSGKSTLLNVIAGLVKPSRGTAIIAGVDVNSASYTELAALRLRHVGVVFQENNLVREFNALENVELPLRASGLSGNDSRMLALDMLDAVGLRELGARMMSQLSGGQRQRVGIARALVGGRSVLIADEPTGALDSTNSRSIFELLRGLADRGVCVVVASHDTDVHDFADRVLTMCDGRISPGSNS